MMPEFSVPDPARRRAPGDGDLDLGLALDPSLLFERHPQPMLLLDRAAGAVLAVNDAALALYGFGRGALLRAGLDAILEPAERARARAALTAAGGEAGAGGPWTHRRADGGTLLVMLDAHALTVGGRDGLLVSLRDVTGKAAAERRAATSDELFRTVFDTSPVPKSLSSLHEGRFLKVNERFAELTGYRVDEIEGSRAADLRLWVDPRDREELRRAVDEEGEAREMPTRLRRRDGSVRRVLVTCQPVHIEDEPCLLVAYEDVTERAAMSADLERRSAQLARLSAAALAMHALTDTEAILRAAVDAAHAILGDEDKGRRLPAWFGAQLLATRGSGAGREVVRARAADDPDDDLSPDDRAMLVQLAQLASVSIEKADLLAEVQEHARTLERTVDDRTARLRAANRELEMFAYSVSHDLRAPLRAIDGFGHALTEEYGGGLDAQARHYLERMRAGTRRMGEMIEQLLAVARVGSAEVVLRHVDVGPLVRQAVDELRGAEPGREVAVLLRGDLTVYADPILLRTAIDNLVGNAWKFTGQRRHGRIEVVGERDGGAQRLLVRDNGVGFDPDAADRLFRPFVRLHDEDAFPGHGIGLVTVQRIAQRHGGRVWGSATPGEGATFALELPVAGGVA